MSLCKIKRARCAAASADGLHIAGYMGRVPIYPDFLAANDDWYPAFTAHPMASDMAGRVPSPGARRFPRGGLPCRARRRRPLRNAGGACVYDSRVNGRVWKKRKCANARSKARAMALWNPAGKQVPRHLPFTRRVNGNREWQRYHNLSITPLDIITGYDRMNATGRSNGQRGVFPCKSSHRLKTKWASCRFRSSS